MAPTESPGDAPDQVNAALTALDRYRERRALDGAGTQCLLDRSRREDLLHRRRRSELVERAVDEMGLPREFAEQVYDVAREEGVEPAFAFELVRCGVSVLRGAPEEPPEATTIQTHQPEWLQRRPAPERARRERMLRASFRRLRRLMERFGSPEDALVAFANEPDVGEAEY